MAYRSSSSATGTAQHIIGTAPAGTAAGDRLLAIVVVDFNNTTIDAATGWTALDTLKLTTPDGCTFRLFEKKVASGSDSYDFNISAEYWGADWLIHCIALTGRHETTASIIQSTSNTSSNSTPISMSLTGVTATAGDDVVLMYGLDKTNGSGVWSYSQATNYTEVQDTNYGWQSLGTQYRNNVSAGATGSLTLTATRASGTDTAGYSGWVIAVPAAAGTVVTTTATGKSGQAATVSRAKIGQAVSVGKQGTKGAIVSAATVAFAIVAKSSQKSVLSTTKTASQTATGKAGAKGSNSSAPFVPAVVTTTVIARIGQTAQAGITKIGQNTVTGKVSASGTDAYTKISQSTITAKHSGKGQDASTKTATHTVTAKHAQKGLNAAAPYTVGTITTTATGNGGAKCEITALKIATSTPAAKSALSGSDATSKTVSHTVTAKAAQNTQSAAAPVGTGAYIAGKSGAKGAVVALKIASHTGTGKHGQQATDNTAKIVAYTATGKAAQKGQNIAGIAGVGVITTNINARLNTKGAGSTTKTATTQPTAKSGLKGAVVSAKIIAFSIVAKSAINGIIASNKISARSIAAKQSSTGQTNGSALIINTTVINGRLAVKGQSTTAMLLSSLPMGKYGMNTLNTKSIESLAQARSIRHAA